VYHWRPPTLDIFVSLSPVAPLSLCKHEIGKSCVHFGIGSWKVCVREYFIIAHCVFNYGLDVMQGKNQIYFHINMEVVTILHTPTH
jgi:hypothetical protein